MRSASDRMTSLLSQSELYQPLIKRRKKVQTRHIESDPNSVRCNVRLSGDKNTHIKLFGTVFDRNTHFCFPKCCSSGRFNLRRCIPVLLGSEARYHILRVPPTCLFRTYICLAWYILRYISLAWRFYAANNYVAFVIIYARRDAPRGRAWVTCRDSLHQSNVRWLIVLAPRLIRRVV